MDSKLPPPDEPAPSYEESMRSKPLSPPQQSQPQTLPTVVSSALSARISSLLDAHIFPFLSAQASSGLHQATAVLVPSTVSALQPPADASAADPSDLAEPADPHETVALPPGFGGEVHLVRLHGPHSSLAFWRQPQARDELRRALAARLAAQGHRVLEAAAAVDEGAAEQARSMAHTLRQPAASKKAGGGGFWRRASRTAEELPLAAPAAGVPPGCVSVRVEVHEVSVRVLTEMGLYDSRTGPAVVVAVEIG